MIAIIDYKSGNIASLTSALDKLKQEYILTNDPAVIKQADKVILPGVGRASSAMQELKKQKLDQVIKNLKQPFLGICLGMQILMEFSEEDNTECLGIIPGKVKRFSGLDEFGNKLSVPQMGWNKEIKINY